MSGDRAAGPVTVRVEMVPVRTQGGCRYDVFHDGEILISRSRTPMCDAARAVAGKGLGGRLELWRRGGSRPAMIGSVAATALLSVGEGQATSPRFVKWRPFDMGDA